MKRLKSLLYLAGLMITVSCAPSKEPLIILDREQGLPLDIIKVSPAEDQLPPITHSDEYEEPVPVQGGVNTSGAEDSPFVTPDGMFLYFTFVPDVRVLPEGQLIDGVTGLYVSELIDGEWSPAVRVVLNDDLSLDGCEMIQDDVIWFCSVRAGNYREVDLYTAELVDGSWVNWKNAGERFNAELGVGEMHITADGSTIYFDGAREGGQGGSDIWVIMLIDGKWSEPENILQINTVENEIRPFITQDGGELWFSRNYAGSPAVFRSIWKQGHWGEPELIISQFAAEPSLDEDGNIYFAHHFIKGGIMLEADIYIARKND